MPELVPDSSIDFPPIIGRIRVLLAAPPIIIGGLLVLVRVIIVAIYRWSLVVASFVSKGSDIGFRTSWPRCCWNGWHRSSE